MISPQQVPRYLGCFFWRQKQYHRGVFVIGAREIQQQHSGIEERETRRCDIISDTTAQCRKAGSDRAKKWRQEDLIGLLFAPSTLQQLRKVEDINVIRVTI